jgi:integrase
MALTTKRVESLRRKPGRYLDGGDLGRGLYLQVTPGGASWLLRYERGTKISRKTGKPIPGERWMGLGALADFSLKEARDRARAARRKLADGLDPLEEKKAAKAARELAKAKGITFREAAEAYFDQNERKWRNAKARAQFLSTLETYAFPKIGALAVADVDDGAVLKVLEQKHPDHPDKTVWEVIPKTSNRIRGRIENVLDWAKVRKYRDGENPARWKGHLSTVLPAVGSGSLQKHHAALPYAEVGQFMAALRSREGTAALALQFTVLTAARTGEVTGARWEEVDLAGKVWTVPAGRIKGGKAHRVPLSDRALEILRACPREDANPHLFIGLVRGSGLSNMGMASVLVRMGLDNVTVHGFRSTFRDWAGETTAYPNHVVEQALAHTVGSAVERAYRRGDLFDKRKRLMSDWARYCTTEPTQASGTVVSIRRAQ